ncbi:MAG: 4-(cytidine 5'-diphospho)-2-C-methyl-D-erythritol kinase, partial [Alphaproteobacteria bacterium]|nr:4-(cytidine 5'-diphospho)-2-C-methyl-D-erythritol kinase [Alphaproteobacteria bacterium]
MGADLPTDEMTEAAPAKVNLCLHVGARRPDGYHDLESLVVFTDFGDRLRLVPSDAFEVERRGTYAGGLPADPSDDLCTRAATGLAAVFGREAKMRIVLDKEIPVAAGLGGGSADAAAVLRALCRAWEIRPDDPRVVALAEELGADVPVCLAARPSFVSGVGERVLPSSGAPSFHLLLVNPGVPLPTASVFGAHAAPAGNAAFVGPIDLSGGVAVLRDSARNDLEGPARSLC